MEYLTADYERRTKYKSVRDAINRDQFSVVSYHGGMWIESRQCPPTIFRRAARELRALYPHLMYIN